MTIHDVTVSTLGWMYWFSWSTGFCTMVREHIYFHSSNNSTFLFRFAEDVNMSRSRTTSIRLRVKRNLNKTRQRKFHFILLYRPPCTVFMFSLTWATVGIKYKLVLVCWKVRYSLLLMILELIWKRLMLSLSKLK